MSGMPTVRDRLLCECMKPEEITGAPSVREARVDELLSWLARYYDGGANPKWLREHAAELAVYIIDGRARLAAADAILADPAYARGGAAPQDDAREWAEFLAAWGTITFEAGGR